jgi:nitronate monooxygenase
VRLNTRLTDLLGIEYPIVQAPIGSATCAELAAAVADSGGLGHLAVTWRSLDGTRRVIEETREATDERFAVNLALDDRTTHLPTDEHLDVVLDAGAPVVSLSFGDPAPHVDRIHEAGAVVMATVGSAEEARAAVEAEVDAVVAQGSEAGGHLQSDVATMPLVPRVVDAVAAGGTDVPVVAAGGIADGRGIAATLALGAAGAWLGTRFVATHEANVVEDYRDRVADAFETDTVRTDLFDGGWPGRDHRVLRNSTVEAWEAAGRPPPGARPGEDERVGAYPDGHPVERYDDDVPVSGATGDTEAWALYAGQSAGTVDAVRPAGEVVERLATETRAALDRLP